MLRIVPENFNVYLGVNIIQDLSVKQRESQTSDTDLRTGYKIRWGFETLYGKRFLLGPE